jgi:hypothetical protein
MKYWTLFALVLFACGSGQKQKQPDFPEVKVEEDDSSSAPSGDSSAPSKCEDNSGNKIECLSDKDCCPGFYCGIDPEGSTRIKTCIFGG